MTRHLLLTAGVLFVCCGASAQATIDVSAREFAEKYGIAFIVQDPPPHSNGRMKLDELARADKAHLRVYLRLFMEEFGKYPPQFVRAAGLKSIIFAKNLSMGDGLERGAIPDYEARSVYYNPFCGRHDEMYQRHVLHHEFFHLADYVFHGDAYLTDPYWASLNRLDFLYGNGGRTARTSDQFGVTNREGGFVNRYSTSGIEEDRAEIFASMWIPMEANLLEQRSRSDVILRAKIQRTRKLFRYFSQMPGDAREQRGRELLDAIRFKRQPEIIKAVTDDGTLLHERDWLGRTPLHWAAIVGDPAIVRDLINQGGVVNAIDDDGWTPLHVAAFAGNINLVRVLLDAGANPNVADKRRLTPFQWATAKAHRELAALLAPRQRR